MNDLVALTVIATKLVRGVQTRACIEHDTICDPHPCSWIEVKRRLVTAKVRERDPLDVIHDEEQLVIELLDILNGDDVRMMNLRREPRLFREHPSKHDVIEEVTVRPLHREEAANSPTRPGSRDVDRRHATRRDLDDELVA